MSISQASRVNLDVEGDEIADATEAESSITRDQKCPKQGTKCSTAYRYGCRCEVCTEWKSLFGRVPKSVRRVVEDTRAEPPPRQMQEKQPEIKNRAVYNQVIGMALPIQLSFMAKGDNYCASALGTNVPPLATHLAALSEDFPLLTDLAEKGGKWYSLAMVAYYAGKTALAIGVHHDRIPYEFPVSVLVPPPPQIVQKVDSFVHPAAQASSTINPNTGNGNAAPIPDEPKQSDTADAETSIVE